MTSTDYAEHTDYEDSDHSSSRAGTAYSSPGDARARGRGRYRGGLLILLLLTAACGGGGGSSPPTSPTPTPTPTPPPTNTTTITITAAGVNPSRITVSPGTRVTFVNNDTRTHEMNSDPHPNHGECPAIDDVGFLQPGQSKQTGNLNVVRTCGFHDHNQPDVRSLQGQIVIQ